MLFIVVGMVVQEKPAAGSCGGMRALRVDPAFFRSSRRSARNS
ncbi:MAG: (Na+)-NQR maturation NqrM [Rhodospirillales bacterium]|nr:(Na+)-NQR maturation NqrM [Rhodospirillales bacterium]